MAHVLFRPWVFAFAAAGLAYVLQLFWLTGIFLMLLAGPIWPGILVNVGMALLAVDCLAGKTMRWLVVVPMAFFLFGIGLFATSWNDAAALAGDLQARGSRAEVPFDPIRQSLVIESDPNENDMYEGLQRELQGNFLIDTVFVAHAGRPVAASLVTPRAQCPDRVDPSVSGATKMGMRTWRGMPGNACFFSLPREPARDRVTIRSAQSTERWGMFDAQIIETRIEGGGRSSSTFTGATRVFAPIPLFIAGCALNSGAARWQCFHMPWTFVRRVGGSDGLAANARTRIRDVAEILGLPERPETVTQSGGYLISPTTEIGFAKEALGFNPAAEAERLEEAKLNAFFDDLPALINEPQRATEARAFIFLSASPEMVDRHIDVILDGMETLAPDLRALDLRRSLAQSLVVATAPAFEAKASRLLRMARDDRIFIKSPGLLARMGDLGVPAAPILLAEFTRPESGVYARGAIAYGDLYTNKTAAAIGLCRIGKGANRPEVRAALRRLLSTPGYLAESAFVALLRIGDRAGAEMYVPANPPGTHDRRLRAWHAEVLKSVTPASPRSVCFPHREFDTDRFPRGD